MRKSDYKEAVEKSLREHVAGLVKRHPEIVTIIRFGSWVNGIPMPGSDVDLCIIVKESGKRFRDRIPDFLPVGFPVGIDIFPYTVDELEALKKDTPSWYREINSGKTIYSID